MDETVHEEGTRRPLTTKRKLRIAWLFCVFVFDKFLTALEVNTRLVFKELELFLGIALTIIGILGFQTGKYCDGNSADYLSCTRPTAYYYYDAWHIAFAVVGVFLIVLWILKRRKGQDESYNR